MALTFEKIKSGEITEDEILSDSIANLNSKFEISPGEAELTSGYIDMSVKESLEQMITISHNYTALLLTDKVGVSKVADFLNRYGFNDSSVGDNVTTTPSDMGLFYEKLYKGEIVGQEYSQKMIELLSKQQIRDRIPKLLPEGIKVANKTGDIGYFENDGGIVYAPNGDYIIVVLSETDSPSKAADKIAEISKIIYEYFNP